MKRTFGKILSFALVLAMLLAMVPAVLAATTESLYLAPGETKTLSCENAKYWRSSNDSVVRVAGGSDGSATITAVASSSSYYGNSATISAYAYEKKAIITLRILRIEKKHSRRGMSRSRTGRSR